MAPASGRFASLASLASLAAATFVACAALAVLPPGVASADDAAKGPASPPPPPPPPASAAAGTIRGTVELTGKAPERPLLRRDTDPICAAVEKRGEDIVVTKGKLAGVLVRLKNGSLGPYPAPTAPATIVQHDCMYEPRVTGVIAGQKVVIKNGDETYHNVRATRDEDYLFNLSQPARAPDLVRDDFKTVGSTVSLHCDVHPWMNAFVVVQDHPFFAVTGDDGSFTLAGVPPGSYELEAWHPVLGLRSTKVKVGKKAKVTARLRFAAPKPTPDTSR